MTVAVPDGGAGAAAGRRSRREKRGERLRRRVHLLPHLFTLGNLFAGFFAISSTLGGDYDLAAIAIGAGIVLDGLDGAVARLVSSSSPIGVQLDSLADVVTFGAAPAFLAMAWGIGELGDAGGSPHARRLVWIASFAFLSATALRLARFNVMSTDDAPVIPPRGAFIGMPTPTAAAVIAVHVHLFKTPIRDWLWAVVWAGSLLVLTGLMVSRVPFPNIKHLLTNPRSPHLLMLAAALVIAAVYYYSEIVLFGLLVTYLGWVVSYNLRRGRRSPEPDGAPEG